MAIDKLGSAQSLIAALRTEVSQRKERAQGGPDARVAQSPGQSSTRDVGVLRKQLAEIARQVDVRDAEAVRKARPKMVRAVLLWEFGPGLREHPEWQSMLESITGALEAQSAEGETGFLRLIESLKH